MERAGPRLGAHVGVVDDFIANALNAAISAW